MANDWEKQMTAQEVKDKMARKKKEKLERRTKRNEALITKHGSLAAAKLAAKKEKKELILETSNSAKNRPKKVSKKALKKRAEKEAEMEIQRQAKHVETREQAKAYLDCWQNNQTSWKFQKKLQIWILQHMWQEENVDDELFKTTLDYVEKLQGAARVVKKDTAAV